jgi:hypothetical protein
MYNYIYTITLLLNAKAREPKQFNIVLTIT